MVLSEDLMLLFLDEEDGRVVMDSTSIHNALAGAVLLELVNSGRVAFEAGGKNLAVVDPAPLPNEFLQESLTRINKPMKPQRAVERLRSHVRDNVMAQLEGRGALISLLYAVKGLHKVFNGDKREMNARAKDIAAGNWAGVAVKKALEAVQAAVMATMVASTVAATSGGGGSS